MEPLRTLTHLAIQALYHEDLYDVTVGLFTEVMANFSTFLTAFDFLDLTDFIVSTRAQDILSGLKEGNDDAESLSFARLLIAYGNASIASLAEEPEDPQISQILGQLVDLLRCEGYAGVEEEVSGLALEFWMTFTEHLIEVFFDPHKEKPVWMDSAQQRIVEVIEACWVKIQWPPEELMVSWDSDARAGFTGFRADVGDQLRASCTLLGFGIYDKFGEVALESLRGQNWLHLEATLFCFNALADSISDVRTFQSLSCSPFLALKGELIIPV